MIVSLSEVKEFLGISTSDDDDLLTSYIGYVGSALETAIDNKICQTTITGETLEVERNFDRQYKPSLDLAGKARQSQTKYYPISSETITYDGSDLIATDDYIVDEDTGHITFYKSVSDYKEKLTITYTAGYDPVPNDLKLVALEAIKDLYLDAGTATKGQGRVESKKIGDFSVKYATQSIIESKYSHIISRYTSIDA